MVHRGGGADSDWVRGLGDVGGHNGWGRQGAFEDVSPGNGVGNGRKEKRVGKGRGRNGKGGSGIGFSRFLGRG